jgi:alkaline phosphatase D
MSRIARPGFARPDRRSIIRGGLALAAMGALGPIGCTTGPRRPFSDDPFTLGVASGDPLHDRVVLWTRLAPRPLDEDGGMGPEAVPVRWQVAEDEGFVRIVRDGEARAVAAHAHSVHVDVDGLSPQRMYFYRFIAAGIASPVGRTRTTPAPDALPGTVRIGQVGCQNYEDGFFTAYRHLADEDLDVVVHTGDYIYEGAARNRPEHIRQHPPHLCVTLAQYRLRYALYKSDPDLKLAHAVHPFAIVFDDHEVANDWADDRDGRGNGGAAFMARRAAALKAWWEHMPLRVPPPAGADMPNYRTLQFGRMVRLNLCDTRQYRTDQPCGGRVVPLCAEASSPTAQMLGAAQESWLRAQLAGSPTRWNVIGQQVLMAELDRDRDPESRRYDMDKWDGYRVPRQRLLAFLAEARVPNPIVLSGDIHRHIVAELRPDFARPETPPVAVEFVNTAISSNGDGRERSKVLDAWLRDNSHLRFASALRGYVRHDVTEATWRANMRVVDRVTVRGAPVRTQAAFAVEAGQARVASA